MLLMTACSTNSKSESAGPAARQHEAAAQEPLSVLSGNVLLDETKTGGMRELPGVGRVLFAHPNHRAAISVPAGATAISISFGIADTAIVATPKTDGVEFRVLHEVPGSEPRQLWTRSLDVVPNKADRGVQHAVIPLENIGGRLILETRPRATTVSDWAYWSNIAFAASSDLTDLVATGKRLDQFHINDLRDIPPLGRVLFAHPRSQFVLPVHGKTVQFEFGIVGSAVTAVPPTDGVEFRVLAETTDARGSVVLWSKKLDPLGSPSDRRPQSATVTVSGNASSIVFETLPGETSTSDWAYWRNIRVQN